MFSNKKLNRRSFLSQSSCAAVGATTLLSTLFNLKTMNASAAFNSSVMDSNNPDDYKALVVLLMEGGMDSFNMLIPRSNPHYGQYATTRSDMAIPQSQLIPINQITPDGREYGLHPNLPMMASLFNTGNLAFLSNVGTLVQPTTKAQYFANSVPLPLGLYSHSDQILHWQTGTPNLRQAVGWGGKMADMMIAANENPAISLSISLSGSNVYQTGGSTTEFSLHPSSGAAEIYNWDNDDVFHLLRRQALEGNINQNYVNAFKKTYTHTTKTGIEVGGYLKDAINNAPIFSTPFTTYSNDDHYNNLSNSFKMIANTISGRVPLGMKRQIFFVSFGGWDMHDNLLTGQAGAHIALDNALHEFNQAMIQLGEHDNVLTFTLSEFARTLTSNGDGTDHAWGGNTFMMGGPVNGQEIYGTFPSLTLGSSNPQEVYGTLIPTTSTDQYFRDIALWFGVPQSDIVDLFPNIGNFSTTPLGFL
jgi:uncharacterized protein (DUF1501 family)